MQIGPYRLVQRIAVGGMGEVCLATLERAGGFRKLVALKQALPALMDDPAFVEMFEREARLAAALSHRNIVQIFDFGRHEGVAWIAMEYVHGADVKALLDQGPLPVGVALEIGLGCARGLEYAHRATDAQGRPLGLVHRDVSPQNVLLSFEGDVKLADFGLALPAAGRRAEGGLLRGKFGYMSPEQVAGRAPDARSDQFALGAVLYEMLAGRRAFFADDGAEAILERVGRARPLAPLAEAAPQLPPGIVAVVERALARNPDDRFPGVGALGEALARAAGDAGIRPGEPALGPWLATRMPERLSLPGGAGPAPTEVTEAAVQPIALELTAAAQVPAGGPPEASERSAPAVPSVPAEPTEPSPRRGRGAWIAALAAAALGGVAVLRPWEPAPVVGVDAAPTRADGRPDAGRPDAGRPDAAVPDASRPDAARPDAADLTRPDLTRPPPTRPRPTRPDRTRPGLPGPEPPRRRSAPPRPADGRPETAAAPPTATRRPAAPPTAAPRPRPPRRRPPPRPPQPGSARACASGARRRDRRPGGRQGLVRARRGRHGGARRRRARTRRADRLRPRATASWPPSAPPFGTVFIDGRDVGPTPAAALPAAAGRRVLEVRAEAGVTELTIEVAP
ncbi:MAG: protein kinase [bacterium]